MNDKIPVLLVEDEPHIAEGLIFNLTEEGYDITHVLSGEEALELLSRKTTPCLSSTSCCPESTDLKSVNVYAFRAISYRS